MTGLTVDSPLGKLAIRTVDGGTLTGIDFVDSAVSLSSPSQLRGNPVARQLGQFFAGERTVFDIDYVFVRGTPFQREVWAQVASIPYGETVTYGDLAKAVGRQGAARAVGAACGQNPISIIVPCHRVVGEGNKLTGYGGGLERKAWLLAFEEEQLRQRS